MLGHCCLTISMVPVSWGAFLVEKMKMKMLDALGKCAIKLCVFLFQCASVFVPFLFSWLPSVLRFVQSVQKTVFSLQAMV